MATLSFDPKNRTSRTRQGDISSPYRVKCVTLWAFLDRGLFYIAQTALGTDDVRTAIVFYARQDITNHLSLIDKLMKHGLSENHFLHKWRPLQKLITRHLAM